MADNDPTNAQGPDEIWFPRDVPEVPNEAAQDEIFFAQVVESRPPRVWPCLLLTAMLFPTVLIVSTISVFIGVVIDGDANVLRSQQALMAWIERFARSEVGLLTLILPGQAVFLFAAIFAAMLSPEKWTRRLGLHAGWMPAATWIVFVAATPFVGTLSTLMMSALTDEVSEHLQMMDEMLRHHAESSFWTLAFLAALLPGVAEELMFRGYLQSRLLKRWSAGMAILVSAVLFSAAHMDPMHALGVMPLGVWLGVVAWRTNSVVPAILCHAANNFTALATAGWQDAAMWEVPLDSITATVMVVSGLAFLVSIVLFFAYRD